MKDKLLLFFSLLSFCLNGCVWTSINALHTLKPGETVFGPFFSAGTSGDIAHRAPAEVGIFARSGISNIGKFGGIEGGLRWSLPYNWGADLKWNLTEEKRFIPKIALIAEYYEGNYSPAPEEGYPLETSAGTLVFGKALWSQVNLFTGYKYVSTRLLSSTGDGSLIENSVHDGLFIAVEFKGEEKSGTIIGVTYLKENKFRVYPDWLKEEKERTGKGILPQETIHFTIAGYFPFSLLGIKKQKELER